MWPLKEPMVVDHQQMPDALLLLRPEILIAAESVFLTPIEKHQRAKSTFADRDQPAPRMSHLAVSRHDQ